MKIKKGSVVDAQISDVAFGGRGLVKLNGLAVFVDQAVPGDRARIRIVRKRKQYAEARLVELISPSEDRIEAPCPYSGICGGCKWQFLKYSKQLEYKRRHVAESLAHIGGIQGVAVHDTIPSKDIFGYRNKMEFTCSDRRWLMPAEMDSDADRDFAIGLHVPGTYYKVLDTRVCLLQPEQGNTLLDNVRGFIRESGVPVYGLRSHEGFWRFLMLRHSAVRDEWMVNIITSRNEPAVVAPLAERLMAEFPQVTSVVNNISARKAGVAQGEYEICLKGADTLLDRIGPHEFEISANSFFQTNTFGAEQLYRCAARYAGLTGNERVVDLYSGTGTIAIWLSRQAAEVIGIELVESAVRDARRNCDRNRIANCRFLQGDIIEQLPQIRHRADVLVIDPPRAGMHKKVVRQVIDTGSPRIVYVSCNPATLARDLAMMKQHYRVMEVQPVDMFPHTHHIEAVARLERVATAVS